MRLTLPASPVESNPRCFQMYVKLIRPPFEVVKEGRILKENQLITKPICIRLDLNKGH